MGRKRAKSKEPELKRFAIAGAPSLEASNIFQFLQCRQTKAWLKAHPLCVRLRGKTLATLREQRIDLLSRHARKIEDRIVSDAFNLISQMQGAITRGDSEQAAYFALQVGYLVGTQDGFAAFGGDATTGRGINGRVNPGGAPKPTPKELATREARENEMAIKFLLIKAALARRGRRMSDTKIKEHMAERKFPDWKIPPDWPTTRTDMINKVDAGLKRVDLEKPAKATA
jgi:hypothetical protein